jgi:hypothetical protein
MGLPCATSIGKPKYRLPYELAEQIILLCPFGLFGRDLPPEEFERGYRERLDKHGVAKMQRCFHGIARKHDDASRLVLLCHEKDPAQCHRQMFSRWWSEQTSRPCPELSWLLRADGTAVVVSECPPPAINQQ